MSIEAANDMRKKILEGYIPTEEEMNEILMKLIGERTEMLTARATKEPKGTKSRSTTKVDLDDLL